jgi:N-acetylglucosaminyldiphosphoundecaprenol N-acetyl-beta-D-mannosaminyltransferase
MQVAKILGVPFSTHGFDETVAYLTDRVLSGEPVHVVTANPEVVMAARDSGRLREILQHAFVVPDGIGIIYAAKWTRQPLHERVTGIELMEALMEQANIHGWRVYLLGASPEVSQKAAQTLQQRYPQAQIVGHKDGYFSKQEEKEIAEEIARTKPHLLFVAMGAPRQDEFIYTCWKTLNVPLAMGVGGSFDVIAGHVKRAPIVWQKLHLEWLYRLLRQPSRWRRQLAIPRFVWAVLRERRSQS